MNGIASIWTNLSSRERQIIGIGTVVASLIILYSLVWSPFQDALHRLRAQVPAKQETLSWMRQQAKQIEPLLDAQDTGVEQGAPLLTIVEASAAKTGVRPTIRRMSPGDQDGQVKIWLTEANFDDWLIWLEALRKQGVEVSSCTVTKGDDNKVNIRVDLQRRV